MIREDLMNHDLDHPADEMFDLSSRHVLQGRLDSIEEGCSYDGGAAGKWQVLLHRRCDIAMFWAVKTYVGAGDRAAPLEYIGSAFRLLHRQCTTYSTSFLNSKQTTRNKQKSS